MNKGVRQSVGKAVIGATLTAIAVMGVGQVASASGTTGTCVTTGIFTASGTCTVLAGEVVNFSFKGARGGLGGYGGYGGNGGAVIDPFVPGGRGGAGGQGGEGGVAALIYGSYANSTDATVTLTFDIGVQGSDGTAGVDGRSGSGVPASNGQDGTDGGNGTAGTESVLRIDSSVIASAQGGAGGTGGTGGKGGTGASGSTPGLNGAPGEMGLKGANGSYSPSPLPDSWMFTYSGFPPPGFAFTAPVTTTAPPQLPATGSDTSPTMWVTLLVLASGGAFVVLARRRVVS